MTDPSRRNFKNNSSRFLKNSSKTSFSNNSFVNEAVNNFKQIKELILASSNFSLFLKPINLSYGYNHNRLGYFDKHISVQTIKQIKSQLISVLIAYILIIIPLLAILSLFSSWQDTQKTRTVDAMSFKSSWNSTINSVSTSNKVLNSSDPKFSYINPYINYTNVNKAYQNDPDHTKKLVDRIAGYIEDNRSRDIYDTQNGSPVKAEFYLETAIKYHVPIDQMLAVARSESRFGTDCYTGSGNLTRICTYKNIFSIGLTESSSMGFNTWEDGVEAFGRLYQNRKDRGYDDCAIWRIYNPNGDYCAKILNLSSKVQAYLDRE